MPAVSSPRKLACKGLICTPSTPAPTRKRRQPTKELLERMTRCEELLRLCLEQNALCHTAGLRSSPSTSSSSPPPKSRGTPSVEGDQVLPSTENDDAMAAANDMSLRPRS
ncbi:Fungal Zn(2)-Cys(6) binuclear cluster domain [Geosmithia morbida]|uniref:Fungal Zn(2)-Cys(6) binuclear cluster domain n=1 Tax=Geosmithia morbida TaxID=1094350 RepID=A0A9P4YTK6_9HYPO|nr:Fungal Zn(2)-Cys(6) binuclear cluster domain [Geosmithia morbida]KAF4122565.1 Fungal Zn(2)-Cys(6) binuclear cluster domain [Geosmithia morbida]